MWRQFLAGVAILLLLFFLAVRFWPEQEDVCAVCLRPTHKVTSYFVTLEGGETVELCCPRCGLRFEQEGGEVASVKVTDYGTGELLDPGDATFVEGSAVHVCCGEEALLRDREGSEYERTWDRCLPSVIAFGSRAKAEDFRARSGGRILQLDELRMEFSLEHQKRGRD